MRVIDPVDIYIEGKGHYENFLDPYGHEMEWLNGVALTDDHYCKYYEERPDWSNKKTYQNGEPIPQHYCSKKNIFMGCSHCCWTNDDCFVKGKSAGVKRVLDRIRKNRMDLYSKFHYPPID